ncbi:60S ribosomal protein L24 [Smittium mucronatum]|uniref:60S ribosomal protein L24 n=1 Tax=Smittium mucronatum TaxID=133383 RepID=A0A1R0H429_9FUNG|nr:60S ribosomal protein L24 [Smittium mucronatum]
MKLEICSFSGFKIYPGHGSLFVRGDSRIFHFISSKSESLFHQAKNPRKISWTVVYRSLHRKGISEEVSKKRTRRTVKYNRAIIGVSWEAIQNRRNEKPEVRAAARKSAVEKAKALKKSGVKKTSA